MLWVKVSINICMYKGQFLQWHYNTTPVRLFTKGVVPGACSHRTRQENGFKLTESRFRLEMRKKFSTLTVGALAQVSRELHRALSNLV